MASRSVPTATSVPPAKTASTIGSENTEFPARRQLQKDSECPAGHAADSRARVVMQRQSVVASPAHASTRVACGCDGSLSTGCAADHYRIRSAPVVL